MINLPKRKDRLITTLKNLKNYNYDNIEVFPAINGYIIDIRNFVEVNSIQTIIDNKRKYHHELSYGAVGCYLSHINLWKKIKELKLHDNF